MMEMRKRGVNVDKIVWGGDRLGIYFLETGAVSRGSKVVYDRAHSAIAEIKPGMIDWDAVFEGVEWFHWTGITPAISQGAADACLEAVKAASAKGNIKNNTAKRRCPKTQNAGTSAKNSAMMHNP